MVPTPNPLVPKLTVIDVMLSAVLVHTKPMFWMLLTTEPSHFTVDYLAVLTIPLFAEMSTWLEFLRIDVLAKYSTWKPPVDTN